MIADCGLRIADCGLRIADCGLRIGFPEPASIVVARKRCARWELRCGLRILKRGFPRRRRRTRRARRARRIIRRTGDWQKWAMGDLKEKALCARRSVRALLIWSRRKEV